MSKIVSLNDLRKPNAGKLLDKPPRVKVCIPYYGTMPTRMMEFIQVLSMEGVPGYSCATMFKHSTLIHFARNEMIDEPEGLEYDYLFFIDSDMGFRDEDFRERVEVDYLGHKFQVITMIAAMKHILDQGMNICGGLYCQRGGGHLPLVFKKALPNEPESPYVHWLDYPETGVHEVDGIATGFLCIKRQVFEVFKQEQDRRIELKRRFLAWQAQNDPDSLPREVREYLAVAKPDLAPPFWCDNMQDLITGKFAKVGEDIYFCREAQKLGFKIYCDFDAQLGHLSEIWFTPDHYQHAYKEDAMTSQRDWAEKNKVALGA